MSEESELAWHLVPIGLPAPGDTAPFSLGERELLLCNADGEALVVANLCPHQRVPLTGAKLRGTVLECPLHGGKFDARDGSPAGLPVRRPGRAFPVRPSDDDGGFQVGLPQ